MKAIWLTVEHYVSLVEKKHIKKIKKIWGVHATEVLRDEASLYLKAGHAQKLGINPYGLNDFLLQAYFGALLTIAAIQKSFLSFGGVGMPEALFDPEQLTCERFRNSIVPLFFTLQLHCYYLVRDINTGKHVTADPLKRAETARKGGETKQGYGEEVLKCDVVMFLAQIRDAEFTGIEALFEPPYGRLGDVLYSYKEGIGSPRVSGGLSINYGEKFDADSLIRKIKEWAASDGDFKKVLDRVIKSKK